MLLVFDGDLSSNNLSILLDTASDNHEKKIAPVIINIVNITNEGKPTTNSGNIFAQANCE